jgi:BirA family transcriptional regulator, biotin operon repressor / biotin---[acetyl-CoA-carboxylase] ligase
VDAVTLGSPRIHTRTIGSTSNRARELAAAGAPHGTLVTAGEQTAGRGRQGRTWSAPGGQALLMSLVLRDVPALLPLRAGLAVAAAIGDRAQLKWPNDVLVDERKVAGILAEARPADGWAILGIGVNVAIDIAQLPDELRDRAGTLGRAPADVEPFGAAVVAQLEEALALDAPAVLARFAARDALRGREIAWDDGPGGRAAGVDDEGRLIVELGGGQTTALNAGEVHLRRV